MRARISDSEEKMRRKVLVIGLDGASWELLSPWIKREEMPNLRRLIENGFSGDLRSSTPALTFPAWKCYSTGKQPGKLGVYSSAAIDFERRKIEPNNSTSFHAKEIWDYLSEEGLKVCIINMPTTYPPKKVNGFLVSGPFSIEREYTFPENLKKELEDKYDYKIIPEYYMTRDKKDLDDAKKVISSRFRFARDVIVEKQIDFMHITIFFTDTIQHFLWDSIEVKDIWKFIDEEIGILISELDKTWDIIVMSDHGFTKMKGRLYLNTWLERRGYLKLQSKFDIGDLLTILDKIGIRFDMIYHISKKLKVFSVLKRVLPEEKQRKLLRMIPGKMWGRKLEGMERKIDWNRSKVIPLAPLIYFNSNEDGSPEIDMLIKKLKEVKNPETGEEIIESVYYREDIYWGEYVEKAPNLIIVPNQGYEISDILKRNVEFSFEGNEWKGTHTQTGIFIAYGPDIRREKRIKGIEIFDLAPTILHIMDVAIPRDMDGKVLREVFEEGSGPDKRRAKHRGSREEKEGAIRFEWTEKDEEKIKDRLRKLGYID